MTMRGSVTRRVGFISSATVTDRNGHVKEGKKRTRIKQVLIKLPVPFVQNPRSAQSKPCGVVQGTNAIHRIFRSQVVKHNY